MSTCELDARLVYAQAVGPVAVTSLLLGSGLPGIIDEPVQDNPNDPKDRHAQDVYNHAAIQVLHASASSCLA